jgi:hypothetical protein
MEMKDEKELEKVALMEAREKLVANLAMNKIDQSYYKLQSVLENKAKENDQLLADVTKKIEKMVIVLGLVDERLKELK